MNKPAWVSFWILGFIWGSSFLLIRVGVEDIPATQLVLVRAFIAAVGLNALRMMRGIPMPRDPKIIRAFIFIGVGNAAIPYTLISLAEQNISSGMAAVLQATASLQTLVIAHFVFSDERMTPQKIFGLLIGFSGVIVLSSNAIDPGGSINIPMLLGIMGMVFASTFYAIFTVYSRTVIKRDIEPIVVASANFIPATIAAAVFVILEPLLGGRAFVPFHELPSDSLRAVIGLGFFNTFIAYLFFYYIVRELGAFRASMVTYIVPVVGLILGWLLLNETVNATMLIGAALIFTGIGVVNLHPSVLRKYITRSAVKATS